MLAFIQPGTPAATVLLVICFLLVLAFEFSNGFHDTANAVATVIYTNSLKPLVAVVWSGFMNFLGVIVGGIAVAYALVHILPPDVLSPPNGDPAVAMLVALFLTALAWNVATWAMGIPNSSSHALIGSLVGISIASALRSSKSVGEGVDWHQIWQVLESLLASPVLGFVLAGLVYRLLRLIVRDKHLYEPPEGDKPPVWWMRAILILTCTGVSFAHGTNDGQKSIGLIMLTIIGLAPATYALNRSLPADAVPRIVEELRQAHDLFERAGDSEKGRATEAAANAEKRISAVKTLEDVPENERTPLRNDVNRVISEAKAIGQGQGKGASEADKKKGEALQKSLTDIVNYAPWWVRVLSALCLGLGTTIGYKRIVKTLSERVGKDHLAPAQGGSAELVSAAVIGAAGFSGFPVSTTHVVTSGIAGTMVGSGAGVQRKTVWQIVLAWVLTLPATIVISGLLFWALA